MSQNHFWPHSVLWCKIPSAKDHTTDYSDTPFHNSNAKTDWHCRLPCASILEYVINTQDKKSLFLQIIALFAELHSQGKTMMRVLEFAVEWLRPLVETNAWDYVVVWKFGDDPTRYQRSFNYFEEHPHENYE